MSTKWRQVAILVGLIASQGCGGGGGSSPPPSPARQNFLVVSGFNPSSAELGDQLTVEITGKYLQVGATCDFGPGVTVNLCEFQSDTRLDAHLTVAPDATEGPRTVTVRIPDGRSGSNSTGFSVKSPAPATTGNLILNIGDSPVGNVLSFTVVIENVKLKTFSFSGTAETTVVNSPLRVEISRLGATAVPFAVATGPTGPGVCSMDITFSHPEVSYLDAVGELRQESATLNSDTATLILGCTLDSGINLQGLQLSDIATVLTLDFNVSSSLSFEDSGGISVNPVVTRSIQKVSSTAPQQYWTGAIENLAGVVTGVFANRFAVDSGPTPLTFVTDGGTSFVGLSGIGELKKGMIVQIDATTGTDGQFTASKVTLEEASLDGQESVGIVTSVSGTPAAQLTLVAQDSLAAGGVVPPGGTELAVSLAGATFEMESEHVDLTSLPFTPSFDAATLFAGQSVIVDTDQPTLSPLPAKKIRLAEQALRGAISDLATNGGQTTFTLTLDPGSAFTTLTGANFLLVIQQPSTFVAGSFPAAPSAVVRGLIFKTDTGYALVASKIRAS